MNDVKIVPVPRPPSRDADPHPLVAGIVDAQNAVEVALYGHDLFVDTPRARVVQLAGSPYRTRLAWAALPAGVDPETCRPGDVLGYADADLPLLEDTSLIVPYVGVRPEARGRGVGRALYESVSRAAGVHGRTKWMTWVFCPGPSADGPAAVPALSGHGAVDGTLPAVQWLMREGFTLEQTERLSVLEIGDADAFAADARVHLHVAQAHAGAEYELASWTDRAPDDLVDGLAVLYGRMSTDVPLAGLDLEEEHWDAARVRSSEDRLLAAGNRSVTTAVRHRPSGVLAGYTTLEWPESKAAGVWQEGTLVRSDHRGRRLGMLAKAANLLALLDANPDVRLVHTWNASENRFMLAVNEALGYRLVGLEAAWQRKG